MMPMWKWRAAVQKVGDFVLKKVWLLGKFEGFCFWPHQIYNTLIPKVSSRIFRCEPEPGTQFFALKVIHGMALHFSFDILKVAMYA